MQFHHHHRLPMVRTMTYLCHKFSSGLKSAAQNELDVLACLVEKSQRAVAPHRHPLYVLALRHPTAHEYSSRHFRASVAAHHPASLCVTCCCLLEPQILNLKFQSMKPNPKSNPIPLLQETPTAQISAHRSQLTQQQQQPAALTYQQKQSPSACRHVLH